ncbi:MAG: hypothetical protein NTV79_08440, partial [Candidatus Aureabacteria bacterium]|nr:hypothetical protein [Candidatus Auribacterota bacterium]
MSFLTKIFGTKFDRDRKKLQPLVDEINRREEEYRALSDEAFKSKSAEFRARIAEKTSGMTKSLAEVRSRLAGERAPEEEEELKAQEKDLREKNRVLSDQECKAKASNAGFRQRIEKNIDALAEVRSRLAGELAPKEEEDLKAREKDLLKEILVFSDEECKALSSDFRQRIEKNIDALAEVRSRLAGELAPKEEEDLNAREKDLLKEILVFSDEEC